MSTGTAALLHAPCFHVPVDRFEIVRGPRINLAGTMERLSRRKTRAHFTFTLRTAASTVLFKRLLSLTDIYSVSGTTFGFTAIYSGQVVSGVYDMGTRTGWFTLD